MARSSKVEECMICGQLPCACGKPEPKLKTKKVRVQPVLPPPSEPERDLDLVNALWVLEPLLSPESRRKAQELIRPPLTSELDRRLIEWREARDR